MKTMISAMTRSEISVVTPRTQPTRGGGGDQARSKALVRVLVMLAQAEVVDHEVNRECGRVQHERCQLLKLTAQHR